MTTLYAETCVICSRRPPEWGLVCSGCKVRMRDQLAALVDEYALLDPRPSGGAGEKVSGTRTAPLPGRLDVLNLVGPGSVHVTDPYGDQTGELPTAVWLEQWVRDWRDVRGQGEHLPGTTVTELSAWLSFRLDWACDEHQAIDEFAAELKQQLGALRAVNRSGEPKPEPLVTPCPTCRLRALVRVNGGDVHCQECGRILRPDEYDQHVTVAVRIYGEAPCSADTQPEPASTAPC